MRPHLNGLFSHMDGVGAGKRGEAGVALKRQQQQLAEMEWGRELTVIDVHPNLPERRCGAIRATQPVPPG